jgi:uncharacterized membrane protein required for colicin V production
LNKLDIIIFFIVLIPALLGLRNGLIKSVFAIIALILGLFIAVKNYTMVSELFSAFGWSEKLTQIAAFISLMLLVYFIIMYIGSKISNLNFFARSIDRSLGLVLGIGKGVIIASIFLLFATKILTFFMKDTVENSKLYPYVIEAAPVAFNFISGSLPGSNGFFDEVKGLIIRDNANEPD